MIQLSEAETERLNSALARIESSDPLSYRRAAARAKLDTSSGNASVSLEDLRQIAALQSWLDEPRLSSHRPILGPLIIWVKRTVYKSLDRWLHTSLARQFELNQRLFNLALGMCDLQERVLVLEKRNPK